MFGILLIKSFKFPSHNSKTKIIEFFVPKYSYNSTIFFDLQI